MLSCFVVNENYTEFILEDDTFQNLNYNCLPTHILFKRKLSLLVIHNHLFYC